MRPSTCSRVSSSSAPCADARASARRFHRSAALGAALLICSSGLFAATPAISIVIDDLGDRWAEGRTVVALPGPVACAILPETPHGAALAALARGQGKEVLLHLPMQPQDGPAHPLSLRSGMSEEAREALLKRALLAVPGAVGVNNHQGSALTREPEWMRWLMQALGRHGGLYFIDSRTAASTVAEAVAWQQGLDATRRQVFLDNTRGAAAVRQEWQRLLQLARRQGTALAIGHPYPETLALLQAELPRLQQQGIRLVAPSALIRLQGTSPAQRVAALRLRSSEMLAPAPEPVAEDLPAGEAAEIDTSATDTAGLQALAGP